MESFLWNQLGSDSVDIEYVGGGIWLSSSPNYSMQSRSKRLRVRSLIGDIYRDIEITQSAFSGALESSVDSILAGDVCCYSVSDSRFYFISYSVYSADDYPLDGFVPVGVVVVPPSHTSDSTARVMSLRYMSCSTPVEGSSSLEVMYWGTRGVDTSLVNQTQYPQVSSSYAGTVTAKSTSTSNGAGGDNLFGHQGSSYGGMAISGGGGSPLYYYFESYSSHIRGPQPYMEDGVSLNPVYNSYCLSDMSGRVNSDSLLSTRGVRDYSSWVVNPFTGADYPAVSCCDMYAPFGTSQGDWYLPSVGELCYVFAHLSRINQSLLNCGGVPLFVGSDNFLMSSTEASSLTVWRINCNDGALYASSKESTLFGCRAFMQVSL